MSIAAILMIVLFICYVASCFDIERTRGRKRRERVDFAELYRASRAREQMRVELLPQYPMPPDVPRDPPLRLEDLR